MDKMIKFLERHVSTAPFSKTVANKCQFTCNACSYTNSLWSTFKNHLSRTGHGPFKVQQYLTKIVLHQCHLCDKKMLCDKHHIQRHISGIHHMQMKDYSAKADAISREQDHQWMLLMWTWQKQDVKACNASSLPTFSVSIMN